MLPDIFLYSDIFINFTSLGVIGHIEKYGYLYFTIFFFAMATTVKPQKTKTPKIPALYISIIVFAKSEYPRITQ